MAQPRIAEPAPPTSVGPYRLVRELGRGGMGHVYEAVHGVLEKRVALKILRPHLLEDAVSVQRFLREGRAACHVEHPHIVEVHELGSEGGTPYLVMELLQGTHLGARLRVSPSLELAQVVEILLPVLSAVSAAHAAGIVHRDLKPSNIMLSISRNGIQVPKVLDFGTSKLRGEREAFLTLTGTVLGTLQYMSPEQTLEPQNADAKSDQYSLGVILYECCTGRRPFVGQSGYELMHAIMTAPVAPPSSLNPALPPAIDAVVLRAMARARRQRYPSLREFAAALLPFAAEHVAAAYRDEFAASSTATASAGVIDAVWAKGAEPDVETAKSGGTWTDPPTSARHVRRVQSLAGVAITAVAVTASVMVASPRREPAGRASVEPRGAPATLQRPVAKAAPVESVVTPRASVSGLPAAEAMQAGAPVAREPKRPKPAVRSVTHEPATARPVVLGDNGAPILE